MMRLGSWSAVNCPFRARCQLPRSGVARAQDERRAIALRQVNRGFARMVMRFGHPGRLLVAGIMLFIEHDQAEVRHWRKERRPRADDYFDGAGSSPLPGVVALAHRQAAMHKRHLTGKALRYAPDRLRRQGDLRHKQNRAPPLRQRFTNRTKVNLGFSAAGHAVQEKLLGCLPRQSRANPLPDLLLVGCQFWRAAWQEVKVSQRISPDLFLAQIQQVFTPATD